MTPNALQGFRTRLAGLRGGLAVLLLAGASCLAQAAPFTNVYIFGDSLSDSGNNAAVFASLPSPPGPTPVPVAGNTFVPTFPYASGHYTDGAVWAQSFATYFGVSAAPSLLGGTDYAYGGARTGPAAAGFPPSLLDQLASFLTPLGAGGVPADALFVIAGGGNNARDALTAAAAAGSPADAANIISAAALGFAADTLSMVQQLLAAGADDIVVWTAPDIGVVPAVRALGAGAMGLGSAVAGAMNSALATALAPFLDVRLFDINAVLAQVIAAPADFGIANYTDACAARADCDPSTYLFWDGIHPTSAGHALIAQAMIARVPLPASLALFMLGLVPVLRFARRRHAA